MAQDSNGNPNNEKHIIMPVTEGKVAEKSKVKKAIGIFLSEDATDIKDHLMDEYIAPRAKSFGLDLVRKSKEFLLDNIVDIAKTMLFGDSKKSSSSDGTYRSGYYDGTKVYYTSYYNNGSSYEGSPYYKTTITPEQSSRQVTNLVPLDLNSYGEAAKVRDDLIALTKMHTYVPVADYYQLCSRSDLCRSSEWEYGWKEFKEKIEIVPGSKRGKYQLVLPQPIPIPKQ